FQLCRRTLYAQRAAHRDASADGQGTVHRKVAGGEHSVRCHSVQASTRRRGDRDGRADVAVCRSRARTGEQNARTSCPTGDDSTETLEIAVDGQTEARKVELSRSEILES